MPNPHDAPRFEALEPRQLLSATPLVPLGAQPEGGLSDKIVYLHAGHGYTADNLGSGAWSTQRPLTTGVVEDLGNQDQMTFLADYLFNAGATVVPLRPVGHQPFEVVLDNDDPGVTFSGNWSNSTANLYFGEPGDVPYRFASTAANQTAVATYRPDLPAEGDYPVYAWTRYGSDRAADQLYRIHHAGGATEVTVNHRRVGNGLVYLGTYHFDRGTQGYVEISNQSTESGRVVIADMIRFGNGVGDIDRGGGVSGQLREDEAGLYWVQWHVDRSQGIPTSEYRTSSADSSATVSLSPRYAEYMNRQADGTLSDRVFVSFHSNAGGGSARGVLALLNGNGRASAATPNQFLLANTLGREVNDDLVAQNGQFEHNWANRSTVTLDRSDIEFGEINNERINNEFDATIVETGFHDNVQDAQMLRDPAVRDALARSTYQGLVNYFRAVDGNATPLTKLPAPVTDVQARPAGPDGQVVVTWNPSLVNGYAGDAPTGYRVFTSTDGRAFDGGTDVEGGSTTGTVITGLDPAQGVAYFKVAAINAGGQSLAPDVVAATPYQTDQRVLLVNGFDRDDRSLNPTQPFGSSTTDRVRPAFSNAGNYAVDHAQAIEAYAPQGLSIATVQNEAVAEFRVNLDDYDAVFWMLGEESSADNTFDAAEQSFVAAYLNNGGNLFVSGAEIAWDLDQLNNGQAFFNQTLRADYAADDANVYQAAGTPGSIFEGITLDFDDGTFIYDVNFPDVLNPANGSALALNYGSAGNGGGAAIQFNQQLVMLGFPFETILNQRDRVDVVGAALGYFGLDAGLTRFDRIVDSDTLGYAQTGSATATAGGFNASTQRVFNNPTSNASATWSTTLPLDGTYEILVQHGAVSNAATQAPYDLQTADGTVRVTLNQAVDTGSWRSLGTYALDAGTNTLTLQAGQATGGTQLSADAVRWVAAFDHLTPGDANLDGIVNFDDAMLALAGQRSNVAQPAVWNQGDFNFDGNVDATDIDALLANYQGVADAPAMPTPPSSVLTAQPADLRELAEGQRISPDTANIANTTTAFASVASLATTAPLTTYAPVSRVLPTTEQSSPIRETQTRTRATFTPTPRATFTPPTRTSTNTQPAPPTPETPGPSSLPRSSSLLIDDATPQTQVREAPREEPRRRR